MQKVLIHNSRVKITMITSPPQNRGGSELRLREIFFAPAPGFKKIFAPTPAPEKNFNSGSGSEGLAPEILELIKKFYFIFLNFHAKKINYFYYLSFLIFYISLKLM